MAIRKSTKMDVFGGRSGETLDEMTRALTVTRFSRLQVLKGLAALSAVAVLPAAAGRRSALAQTTTDSTVTITGAQPNLAAYMTAGTARTRATTESRSCWRFAP